MGMFDFGVGGLYKGLKSFMNPEKGYKKAQEQFNKYYDQSQQYMLPYHQQGQEAYGGLNNAMQALLNPAQLQNEWASGYQTSPYAQQLQDMASQQGLNAASSMGLMGSSPALQAIQAGTSQIGNQDRQNYMDALMQKYMHGAQLAQGIYGQGAQAGNQLGQNAMTQGQNMAEMAYGQQAAPGQMFENLLKFGLGGMTGGFGGQGGQMGGQGGWSTTGGR